MIRIKVVLWVYCVFEIVFWGEIIEVIFVFMCFYLLWYVIVYFKKIDICVED